MQRKDIQVGGEYALYGGHGRFNIADKYDRSRVKRVRVTAKGAAGDRARRDIWGGRVAVLGYAIETLDTETGTLLEDGSRDWVESGHRLIGPWGHYVEQVAEYKARDDKLEAEQKQLSERCDQIERELLRRGLRNSRRHFSGARDATVSLPIDGWETLLELGPASDAA